MPKNVCLIDALYNACRIKINRNIAESPIPPKCHFNIRHENFSNWILILRYWARPSSLCICTDVDADRCDGAILLLMLFKLSHRA